jgi:hypothetical protein
MWDWILWKGEGRGNLRGELGGGGGWGDIYFVRSEEKTCWIYCLIGSRVGGVLECSTRSRLRSGLRSVLRSCLLKSYCPPFPP